MKRFGATPEDWAAAKRLAKVDLLPVVSNPQAKRFEKSHIKTPGKTPSLYMEWGGEKVFKGFPDWTDWQSTVPNIEAWQKEPDYGICIQTRRVRGLDIDLPDVQQADRAQEIFARKVGVNETELPTRVRAGSGRRLVAFVVSGLPDGERDYLKRGSFKTETGLVEFLATGQQFIAAGTHPSGSRYEWVGGWPKAWPVFEWDVVQAAFREIYTEMGLEGTLRGFGESQRGGTLPEDLDVDDPVALHLLANWPTYHSEGGKLFIECPWKAGHSSDSGDTETAWLLAGTSQYRNGHLSCLHASCASRTRPEFCEAVGYKEAKADDFEDETKAAVAVYTAMAPGASPKSKELKASAQLPLPGFNRDNQGRIEATLENVYRALNAVQACGVEIAFDEFRGELMVAEQPGAWRSITDADQVRLRARIEALGFKDRIGKELMRDALEWVGDERRFDSAQTWLTEVVPKWDGVSRVSSFLHRYMAAEDSAYSRAVSRYIWTALAGRIMEPGCKADMVPVLVGPQGARKSSGIAAMSPAVEFFSEFSLEDRDDTSARKMRGCLVGELAELKGLQTRDRESILSWITRQHEEWVPKYKEHKISLARRCLFVGSTNDDEFLSDPTGERRWLPVMVLGHVDVNAIKRDRLQLWAEGYGLWCADDVMFEGAERLARLEHDKFKATDPWLTRVGAWLEEADDVENNTSPRTRGNLTTHDVLTECLGLQDVKIGKREEMRVAAVLKKLGMEKVQKRVPTTQKQVGTGRHYAPKVWVEASK